MEIEIANHAWIAESHSGRHALVGLRALGVSVALGECPAVVASLSLLSELPFDKVKLDASLLQIVNDNTEVARNAAAVFKLCRTLDVEITAEGIETEAAMENLRDRGCTYGQGGLFGGPASAEEAGRMLAGRTVELALG